MIFDSHCHPQFPQYESDREEMIKRALNEGVFMICIGTDLKTSKEALELAYKYEKVWATVGLHPTAIPQRIASDSAEPSTSNDNLNEKFEAEIYQELLSKEKVVGFGEIGLDYYRTEKPEDQSFQKQRFEEQLDLAKKINKPVVIHCRDPLRPRSEASAHSDMIQILKSGDRGLRGVIHSFTGTLEEAKQYLDLGFYLAFNGIITFTDQYDEIVKYTPLEKILLETDAPYLTPLPFRGKRNEPLYVKYVAERIAQIKKISYDEAAKQTFENTQKLFGLK